LNEHKLRKDRLRREWLLTAITSLLLLGLLTFGDLARPLSNVLYDHLMRLHGFKATENIVIVAIDDRSLQELGGWPLQRGEYTKLLTQLADNCCKPKAIGLDLLFLDSTAQDSDLATSLKKIPAVLPIAFKPQDENVSLLEAIRPVVPLSEAATLAHINLSFDADGVIRGISTREFNWPHFSLALKARGSSDDQIEPHHGDYRRFRMVDPSIGFPVISLVDAIKSSVSQRLLKDKYVLLGVTAPSLGDRYPTLYSGKNNASTPGVAILASVLNASLDNTLIELALPWTTFGLTLLPLFIMLQSLVILHPRQALIFAIFLVGTCIAASYALLTFGDYWMDPIPFVLLAVLIQPLWAWRRLEAILHLVQDKAEHLRHFLPAERVKEATNTSREVVLQNAKLLDHAVASARSELDFLTSVIDEMPEAVLIFNNQDQLILSNQKISKLFQTELTCGYSLVDFSKLTQLPLAALSNKVSLTKEKQQQAIFEIQTAIGLRNFIVKTALLNAPLGGHLNLLILMDITELRQSQTQRDRALQFLSHDMRTPIASILSLTREGEEINISNTQAEKITHHAKALLQMMDDFILTISAEASQYKVHAELLDNLLNDSLEQVLDLAEAKNIQLQDQTHVSNVFILADRRLLVRAFVNLLVNAVKFSPVNSLVRIDSEIIHSAETQKTQVTLTISNPVSSNNKSVDITPSMLGFGLGLNFVDTVLQKHQGLILRELPIDGLATVKITLPCDLVSD
jgi:CHASE2 domain-containing sensor protein/signal transduction histidine kinase